MYLAMRTAVCFSLVFFLMWGMYLSLFRGLFSLFYSEEFEAQIFLFGVSLIGISSMAIYNFKSREAISTYLFCALIFYMVIIFYIVRTRSSYPMTFFDFIPLIGAFSILFFVFIAHRPRLK